MNGVGHLLFDAAILHVHHTRKGTDTQIGDVLLVRFHVKKKTRMLRGIAIGPHLKLGQQFGAVNAFLHAKKDVAVSQGLHFLGFFTTADLHDAFDTC